MREIKFLTWIKSQNRMAEVFGLCYEPNGKIGIEIMRIGREFSGNKWDMEFWYKDIEAILMQFTGLADVYDKEIYEGDIVKSVEATGIYNSFADEDAVGIIEYGFGGILCCNFLKKAGKQKNNVIFKDSFGKKVKIIGNIFENPELMIIK